MTVMIGSAGRVKVEKAGLVHVLDNCEPRGGHFGSNMGVPTKAMTNSEVSTAVLEI